MRIEPKDFTIYPYEYGYLYIACENGKVIRIDTMKERYARGKRRTALTDRVAQQIEEFVDGERQAFDFPYELRGTPFEVGVWQAIMEIPYGETRTYGDIARAVGRPRAWRAVAAACHRNPLSFLVPCQRVLRADGGLGEGSNSELRGKLLDLEQWHMELGNDF